MSYYILPKINIEYGIQPCIYDSKYTLSPYISSSLVQYMADSHHILDQQMQMDVNVQSNITSKMLNQVVHNYDFLFCHVSGYDMSVSSVKTKTPLYFDITEIYQTIKIYEKLPEHDIHMLFCGKNSSSAMDAIADIRCDNTDTTMILDQYKSHTNLHMLHANDMHYYYDFKNSEKLVSKCHFIYFEESEKVFSDVNDYVLYIIKSLLVVCRYQAKGGCFIVKINSILYKPIIDLIYIITSMYEKTYIMKPNASNIILDERYIVCKSFLTCSEDMYKSLEAIYRSLYESKSDIIVSSILSNKLYYYFLVKLEESNIIIGQQKLDAYGQLINLLKSKNKIDKIELLQKHNIQKCVYWCEKYKVPYNKITDRANAFVSSAENDESVPPIDIDIDELFYSYMDKHYGDTDNMSDSDNESCDNDLITSERLNSYIKMQ